jgi:hypothetical protein
MGVRIDGKTSVSDVDHDSLGDLKGGDAAGYFHNTSSMNTILVVGGTSGYILSTRDSGYTPEWVYPGILNLGDPTREGAYINGTQDGANFYWAENYPDVSGTVFTSQGSGYLCVWAAPSQGVVDHALLTHLDYTSSAHTGFAQLPTVPGHLDGDLYNRSTGELIIVDATDWRFSFPTIDGGAPDSTYSAVVV